MARIVSSCVAVLAQRRGFSVAAAALKGIDKRAEEKATKFLKAKKEVATMAEEKAAWVPDPVTGCYLPANRVGEVDAAELREMLLKERKARK